MTAEPRPSDGTMLQVLVAIRDAARVNNGLDVEAITAQLPALPAATVEREIERLLGHGLITAFRGGAGLAGIVLLPEGAHRADAFDDARREPGRRLRQLQDDYLRWLHLHIEELGEHPSPTDFLREGPTFLGVPYTDAEVMRAGVRLRENGFIEGDGRYAYPAPTRPSLTEKARRLVEDGASVHDRSPAPGPQVVINSVAGNGNIAYQSPHATQSVTEGWAEEATRVLDAVAQSLASLPVDMKATVERAIADAREGVEASDPGPTRRALRVLGGYLGGTASGALGGVLATTVTAALPFLGG